MDNTKVKAFFDSLVGMNIDDACKKLGYWWVCINCHVTTTDGWYLFERAAGGRVELHTKNNIVSSEYHNKNASLFAERDICTKDGRD